MRAPRTPTNRGVDGKPIRNPIRTSEKLVKIIRREYNQTPPKPIRVDLDIDPEVLVFLAEAELERELRPAGEYSLRTYVVRQIMRNMMQPESLVNTPPDKLAANSTVSWHSAIYEIFGRESVRVVFYGPKCNMPLPLEFIPFTANRRGGQTESFDDFLERIARSRGVHYHVEADEVYLVTLCGRAQYISYATMHPVHVKGGTRLGKLWCLKGASVWRGEDWMRSVCDAFWPSELPGLMSVGRRALGLTEQARLAERSRAQIDRCRAIQKLGVNARAKKRQDRTKYICDQQNRLPEHLMAKERDRELIEQLKLHDRECCDKSDSALKSIVHRALGLKK